jgi:hypothetical protein
MTNADEDVAEAEAAARRALGVCLYPKPGCGAHQRFDSAEDAQAWCAAHQAAHPDHRVEVWPGRIDDLAVVNPITRAMYASLIDAKRVEAARRADPDWGKTIVSPEFYEAVRERAENSAEMTLILNHIRPMTPMEAPPDERSDPRTQPIPIGRRRKARRRRA